jgi:hypothetical protein
LRIKVYVSKFRIAALEIIDMEESQPCGLSTDPTREWEIRNIIGQKTVDGNVHYCVDCKPTWMPESDLHRAEDLIDRFTAQLQCARRESSNRDREVACSKRGSQEEGRYVALNEAKAKIVEVYHGSTQVAQFARQ